MTTIPVPAAGSTVVDTEGRTGTAEFNPNTGQPLSAPGNVNTPSGNNNSISTNSGYSAPAADSTNTNNTNTQTSTSIPLTPSQQAQYSVAQGDTLSSIATKYGTSINSLMSANPSIKNPNQISAGSTLNLPKGVTLGGTPGSTSSSGSASKIQSQYYDALGGTNPNHASDVRSAASTVDTSDTSSETAAPNTDDLVNNALQDYQNTYNTLVNYESNNQSVAEFQAEGAEQLGIPQMDTQLMNVKNLLNGGSEQGITDEINSAGSFATQGQIENLTYSVNKTLLLQANALQTSIDGAQENLSNATAAYQGDQTRTIQAFQDKLSSDSNFISMQQSIQTKAADNYNKIVSNAGYKSLAATLSAADPTGQSLKYAESVLGLPSGTLSNPQALAELDTYREQTISQSNTRLEQTYGITPDQINSLGGNDSGIQATDGGTFAQFPSMEQGIAAAKQLLASSTYSGLSLNDAMQKWSGGGYGAEIAPELDPSTPISSLSQDQLSGLINDMATAEGGQSAAGYAVNNPLDIKYVPQAQTAVGVTPGGINSSAPGYSTVVVPGTGGNTQAAIDQAALSYALTGQLPAGGRASTGAGLQFAQAVRAQAANLNSGGNIQANKAQLSALSTSLTAQTTYKNNIQQSLTKAEGGFSQLMTAFSGSGIDPSESTIVNSKLNSVAANLTGGSLFAYKAGLAEISADYSQVFARNGVTSVATQSKAADILSGDISFKDLQAVQTELQAQGNTAINSATSQISSIQGNINDIITGSTSTSSSSNTSASSSESDSGNSATFVHGALVLTTPSGEKSYTPGQSFSVGGMTLMVKADGTLVDTTGNTGVYTIDANGDINKQ